MRTIRITDITVRDWEKKGMPLSFKEKVEMTKVMDRLNYSCIELPQLSDSKGDELLVKTIAGSVKMSEVALPAELTEKGVERAWDCIAKAKKPVISIAVPVSAVQMEYVCGKKAPQVVEMISTLTAKAKQLCHNVEFSALDATRAEHDFLVTCIKSAVVAGATKVTICDTAGVMLPEDTAAFIKGIIEEAPEVKDICLAVDFSNELDMSTACAFAAIEAGVSEIKTTVSGDSYPQVENVVRVISKKGENIGVETTVVSTELSRAVKQIERISGNTSGSSSVSRTVQAADNSTFNQADDINIIADACKKLGYDLSEEDMANVYEAFLRVATKKENVTGRELEAIVASTALQVPPTYKLQSYVINSGNIISATANVIMQKGDKEVSGISTGDGPIDAAFKAIEQILGHHYELDDFQIQSVTEGREATGQAIVKLRANGTLYSGTGISTDIIGAAISAYVNAINKIVYTEA